MEATSGRCNPANLVLTLTRAVPMGLLLAAMHSTAVIVDKNPGEYSSLDATLLLVSSMGAACLVSRLFSMSKPNFIGSYAVTILGLCLAERN
jgi:hypothetical protein